MKNTPHVQFQSQEVKLGEYISDIQGCYRYFKFWYHKNEREGTGLIILTLTL